MLTKPQINQLYSTVMSIVFIAVVYLSEDMMRIYPMRYISFFAVFPIVYGWVMTLHNKPNEWKWYAGIMGALGLLFIYLPMLCSKDIVRYPGYVAYYLRITIMTACFVCVAIATYRSKTRYYNFFPNQHKAVSKIARILIWFIHIMIWYLVICTSIKLIYD